MTDVRIPSPGLGLADVASSEDDRITNLLAIYADEPGDAADCLRWALRSLQIARRSLHRLRAGEGGAGPDAQVIADQGLIVAPE